MRRRGGDRREVVPPHRPPTRNEPAPSSKPGPVEAAAAAMTADAVPVERDTMGSASLVLVLRRALTLLTAGLSTALLSRILKPASFGDVQVGLAAWTFATGLADLAFSQVLGRELVATGRARAALLRTGYQVQGAWAVAVTGVLAAAGLVAGADTTRGQVLLVLCPTVAAVGLTGGRAVLLAMNQVGVLVRIDLAFNLALSVGMVAVAAAGGGPVAVTAVFSAFTAPNARPRGGGGARRGGGAPPLPGARRRLVRLVVPLSVASVFGKVYLTAPLLLLGWLSTSEQAGQYGGAVRIIATLNSVVAVVMTAALPALTRALVRPAAFAALAAKVLSWLMLGALPLFLVVGVLAGPVTRVTLGPEFGPAAQLTAVLALAGGLATLTQLFQTLLVAASTTRSMVFYSAVAALLSVAGGVLLIPRYGAQACAWLTVATEVVVCAGALLHLPALVPRAGLLRGMWRPLVVVAGAAAALLALHGWPVLAVAAALLVYALLAWRLRCWPTEWRRPGRG